ncbi:hypothetical protein ASPWEDRAFT_39207 [Aspergillus wentii DTO 134E9]|uniref:N-acetyltransferase domain-containing protein n=1 Tax=Aspergillus wentii DTO 134E9 TaxID=1073089 RepID=A0A1L9RRG4_ASPWE|nr:uncharacterized protein ASPWEDRAFT_39207 [Aspergillus wentii DTO 134E9]KAI9930354.1 hypothetical protein MW887_011107 [Aspergillus wentii]OJJ37509.1 hypothetical protein ASPWEDRAFT_39207 [Aspergillus wentii DTO 134E9]
MIAADLPDSIASLPQGDSPEIVLVPATPEERIKSLELNSIVWKGLLDIETYIARENHLHQQRLTRDGLTCWILVDRRQPVGDRTILSSCETYKKKALLAFNGKVEEVSTHGVGSVYCRPEFRGKGYAKRMVADLSMKLDTWQMEDEPRHRSLFTVLYSDIGKSFYAKYGWKPFLSSHISLPPISKEEYGRDIPGANLPKAKTLVANDVQASMCSDRILQKERELLRVASEKSPSAKVAISPNFDHFVWHWAREEFLAERMHPDREPPTIKGAGDDKSRVYCAWNRNFGETPQENTLYILRWVYDEPTTPEETEATSKAIAAVLRRAQLEAHEWNMAKVEFWNPTPLVQKAVHLLDPTTKLVHRENDSIASLKWTGDAQGFGKDVEWWWNEKYAWC